MSGAPQPAGPERQAIDTRCLPTRHRRAPLRLLPHLRQPPRRQPLQAHLPPLRLLPQLRRLLLTLTAYTTRPATTPVATVALSLPLPCCVKPLPLPVLASHRHYFAASLAFRAASNSSRPYSTPPSCFAWITCQPRSIPNLTSFALAAEVPVGIEVVREVVVVIVVEVLLLRHTPRTVVPLVQRPRIH